MSKPLTEEERIDIHSLASGLSNKNMIEGLKTLLDREVKLLEHSDLDDIDSRKIILHNLSILAASIAKIEDLSEYEGSNV